jgi:hypothetical protein
MLGTACAVTGCARKFFARNVAVYSLPG